MILSPPPYDFDIDMDILSCSIFVKTFRKMYVLVAPGASSAFYSFSLKVLSKGQENPEFCASVTFGSFPCNLVVGPGTSGNCPFGHEF